MPGVTLKAHDDGERIVLDEPCEIAPLMVTVLSEAEESAWTLLSVESLARAFSEDEPKYRSADIMQ